MYQRNGPVSLGMVEKLECRVYESGGHGGGSGRLATASPESPGSEGESPGSDLDIEPVLISLRPCTPTVHVSGPHAAVFTWNEAQQVEALPAGTGVEYILEVENDGQAFSVAYAGPDCRCEVERLRAGRAYRARVRVVVSVPEAESAEYQVTCEPGEAARFSTPPTLPSVPGQLQLVSRERKALKVKWPAPEEDGGAGEVTYTLVVSPPPTELDPTAQIDSEGWLTAYRGPERTHKLARLTPGQRYSFRVRAANRVGESRLSELMSFATQATVPSQPEPPAMLSSSSDSVIMRWAPPAGNGSPVSSYRLERSDGDGCEYQLAYAGPNENAIVGGLRSGVRYQFRLLAENSEGKSMWSGPAVATTAAVAPGSPVGTTVVAPKAGDAVRNSATLSWRAPHDDGGSPVTGYEVHLQAKCRSAIEHMDSEWLCIFEGDAHACTISALRAGCTYRARVRARSAAGWGLPCAAIDVVTGADVPDAPEPPTLGCAEPTFLGVDWRPPSHTGGAKVTSYQLEVAQAAPCACGGSTCGQTSGEGSGVSTPCEAALPGTSVQMSLSGDVCCAEIRDLQAASVYFFRVQAGNAQGLSNWSAWARLTTAPDAPEPPPGLSGVAISATAAALRWDEAQGSGSRVTAYVVEAQRQGGEAAGPASPPAFTQVWRGAGTCCDVRGLAPATPYAFRVAAVNAVGTGAPCAALVVRTAPAAPGAPSGLAAAPMGASDVALSWAPPEVDNGAAVTGYLVDAARGAHGGGGASGAKGGKKSGAAVTWAQVYAGPTPSCTVPGLQPGREYQFRVRAANAAGIGPACDAASAVTAPAPPSAPLKLATTQRMSGGLKLRWEEPAECFNAPVTEYVVQVAPRDAAANGGTDGSDNCGGSSERAWRAAYAVASPSARVSDLAPNTAYVVRVRAANAAGAGPWSEELVAMTALLPPGPPEVACLVACGMGSGGAAPPAAAAPGASDAWVVLSWAPPAHAPDCAQAVSFEVAATAVTARPASVAAASEPAASVAVVAASGAAADGGDHHRAPPPPEPHRASATGAGMMERAASSSLYAPPAAAAPAARLTVGKGVGEARLEGLARGSNYAVRVRSVGAEGAGHGAWSPEMLVSTPGEPPAVDHATGGVAVGAGLGAAGGTAGTAGHGAKGGKKGNKGGGGGGKNGGVGGGAGGAAASSRSSEDGPSSLPGGRKGSNGAVPGVDGSGGSSSSGGAPAAVSIQRKSKVLAACSAAPAAGLPPKPRTGLSAAVANSRLYREHLRRPLRMLYRWRACAFWVLAVVAFVALGLLILKEPAPRARVPPRRVPPRRS
ncbi:hypothetical protein FOA52_014239 [Chlamydomonas sp. UWO 241]|nr:hypothetical protein FOA52_014239 [Chlamydomonas sp. UWO 241]